MAGFIRKREVVMHAVTVVRAFGFKVFVRCLLAKRGATFLTVLSECGRI